MHLNIEEIDFIEKNNTVKTYKKGEVLLREGQTTNKKTKSIKLTFALVGLYLYLKRGFTGK